ncbi:ABC transporter substrate-binding protein [Saccharopolyspora sp. 5N708]|uniref:ABC transporter substrate-binding protein n=1 Tax=Saccharopolyspora sp. 5N708 TaxID=3457424 RepID=UPI003FCF2981
MLRTGLVGGAALAAGSLLSACDTPGGPVASGKTKIRVWTWYTQQREQWPQLIDEFQRAHPNIVVENRLFGSTDSYLPALQAMVSAGNPPDIFGPHVLAVEYGKAGVTADLRAELGSDFVSGFFPSTNEAFADGGKQYALGWMAQTFGLLYDPEIFRQAGADVPETWDELVETAGRIRTATNKQALVVRNNPGSAGLDFFLPLIAQVTDDPGLVIDLDQRRGGARWDSAPVIEALRKVETLLRTETIAPNGNALKEEAAQRMLYTGAAAMLFAGSWVPQDLQLAAPPEFVQRYRVMPVPAWAPGRRHWTANQCGAALAVSAVSKNKQAALEFLNFAYQPQRYARIMNQSTSMPSTRLAAEQVADPLLKQMTSWLVNGDGAPHILFGKGSSAAASNAFAGLMGGQSSPEQTARAIQSEVERTGR